MRILTLAQLWNKYPKRPEWNDDELFYHRASFYGGAASILDVMFGKYSDDFKESPKEHLDTFQSEINDFEAELKARVIKEMFGSDLNPKFASLIEEAMEEIFQKRKEEMS